MVTLHIPESSAAADAVPEGPADALIKIRADLPECHVRIKGRLTVRAQGLHALQQLLDTRDRPAPVLLCLQKLQLRGMGRVIPPPRTAAPRPAAFPRNTAPRRDPLPSASSEKAHARRRPESDILNKGFPRTPCKPPPAVRTARRAGLPSASVPDRAREKREIGFRLTVLLSSEVKAVQGAGRRLPDGLLAAFQQPLIAVDKKTVPDSSSGSSCKTLSASS